MKLKLYHDILLAEKPQNLTRPQAKRYARRLYNLVTGKDAPAKIKLISSASWVEQYSLNTKEV